MVLSEDVTLFVSFLNLYKKGRYNTVKYLDLTGVQSPIIISFAVYSGGDPVE